MYSTSSYNPNLTPKVCRGYWYAFNGMEKDDEVKGSGNSYTTEFRQYDPRLGRWLTLDPLSTRFPWQSSYITFDNNPVKLIDARGLSSEKKGEGNTDSNDNSTKNKGLNILVIAKDRDEVLNGDLKSVASEGMNLENFKVLEVENYEDLEKQLSEIDGLEINNLYFVSHGGSSYPYFKIGNEKITHKKISKLATLKKYMSDESNVIIHSCHTGGGKNPEASINFTQKLANVTGATTFTSQGILGTVRFDNSQPGTSGDPNRPFTEIYSGVHLMAKPLLSYGWDVKRVKMIYTESGNIKVTAIDDKSIQDWLKEFDVNNPELKGKWLKK